MAKSKEVVTVTPSQEYWIIDGPGEKGLIFSLFANGRDSMGVEFAVVRADAPEIKRVRATIHLVERDDCRKVAGMCYYLTGDYHPHLPGSYHFLFVALYDPQKREGRFFPITNEGKHTALHSPSHAFIDGELDDGDARYCGDCGGKMRWIPGRGFKCNNLHDRFAKS
ncbi:MAG TPA: hypothetical protein VMT99_04255 [Candidatus Paceibacterota bacterium]|nr:hypothetical protein [Candidatus Paceibacterota bacterium]